MGDRIMEHDLPSTARNRHDQQSRQMRYSLTPRVAGQSLQPAEFANIAVRRRPTLATAASDA